MSPNCHSEEPFEQPIGRDIQSVLDRLREAARTAPETDPSYTPQNYNDPEWQRGWLARKRFEAAGIPALFAEKSIDDYKPDSLIAEQIIRILRRYIAGASRIDGFKKPNGLLIWGPRGTGKSHLACAVLSDLIRQGATGLYLCVPDWFMRIRGCYNQRGGWAVDGESEDELIEEAIDAKVLLLDDLGTGKENQPWQAGLIYQIVDNRTRNGNITIITTNHRWPDELEPFVGERVISRLYAICTPINTEGLPDWRLKGHQTRPNGPGVAE